MAAAAAALDDAAFIEDTTRLVREGRDYFYHNLDARRLTYQPSQANFVLVELGPKAPELVTELLKRGVIVRGLTSYGYPRHIRVNVGLRSENEKFVQALDEVLAGNATSDKKQS